MVKQDVHLEASQQPPSQPDPASLKLIASEAEANCSFWIGLSRPGSLHPHSLLGTASIQSIFDQVAAKGISEGGPLMLSDLGPQGARFLYLLPPPSSSAGEQQEGGPEARWVASLLTGISSWLPRPLGFYFVPGLLGTSQATSILQKLLTQLIGLGHKQQGYYVLLGKHDFNAMLNASLALRQNTDLLIYH